MTTHAAIRGPLTRSILLLVAVVLLLAGCTGTAADRTATPVAPAQRTSPTLVGLPKNGDGYVDLTVQQLSDALPGKDFTLVNVHIPYEGELPKTDLFIPYDVIEKQAGQFPDKGALIVLYCRSGRMSTDAAKSLVRLGYTNVLELDGGTSAWESAGYKLLYKQ